MSFIITTAVLDTQNCCVCCADNKLTETQGYGNFSTVQQEVFSKHFEGLKYCFFFCLFVFSYRERDHQDSDPYFSMQNSKVEIDSSKQLTECSTDKLTLISTLLNMVIHEIQRGSLQNMKNPTECQILDCITGPSMQSFLWGSVCLYLRFACECKVQIMGYLQILLFAHPKIPDLRVLN